MIVCAGNNELFEFATPMGVGMVDMAMHLTRACMLNPPEFLLFVGSAGSYGGYAIFDVVQSMQAAHIELSFLDRHSYTPIDNVISAEAKGVSHETIVNSSNYITTDASYGTKMQALGIGLENMEFFAFLRVAQEFGIPAGGVFVVTNYTNAQAHEDFKRHHKEALDTLSHYLYERMPQTIMQSVRA
ncbi:MAG: purine nucleoside phosphorylase [Sulfuricurvum sp. PC08-66]|nr:MAG: purine nucleoside phosphorylase [Sulfuricurvum sp. PC08-66]